MGQLHQEEQQIMNKRIQELLEKIPTGISFDKEHISASCHWTIGEIICFSVKTSVVGHKCFRRVSKLSFQRDSDFLQEN